MSPVRCVMLAFVLGACAAAPRLDPSLGSVADVVVREMELAATADVPEPPLMPYSSQGWPVIYFGTIVGVRNDAFAARIDKPEGIPTDVLHYLVPVSDDTIAKGDGVVTARIDDILVCRFFPLWTDPGRPPQLGDRVHIDWQTTRAVRKRGWKEECERRFARRRALPPVVGGNG